MRGSGRCWQGTLLVLMLLLALQPLGAHELLPVLLELREPAPGRVEVLWQVPLIQGQPPPLTPVFPGGCRPLAAPRPAMGERSLVVRSTLRCGFSLAGQPLAVDGLEGTATEVLMRWQPAGGTTTTQVLRAAQPRLTLAGSSAPGAPPALPVYLLLGMEHILQGPDHLLFVLGLLLIVGQRWRVLVKTITAFTVAHSLTLAATTLGMWRVPTAPLEAAIALSILFLAPEIVRTWRGQSSLTIRRPWLVAFAFGLLHGAGLATALQDLGLPRGETLQALALFNLGVELGQLAFIALLLVLLRLWRLRAWPEPLWLRRLPGYLVGGLGAYWVIERTMTLVAPIQS
ncbi:MAG: HupE/UreJ family protein [Cyanobium sp.]